MVGVRYVPNRKSMARLMSTSPALAKCMGAVGRDVMAQAIAIAPVSLPHEKGWSDGTRYNQRFTTSVSLSRAHNPPRFKATVANSSKYSAHVEFGTGRKWKGSRPQGGTPGTPNRVLGRAAMRVLGPNQPERTSMGKPVWNMGRGA